MIPVGELVGALGLIGQVLQVQHPAVAPHVRSGWRNRDPEERHRLPRRDLDVEVAGGIVGVAAGGVTEVEELVEHADLRPERSGVGDEELQQVRARREDRVVGAGLVEARHREHVVLVGDQIGVLDLRGVGAAGIPRRAGRAQIRRPERRRIDVPDEVGVGDDERDEVEDPRKSGSCWREQSELVLHRLGRELPVGIDAAPADPHHRGDDRGEHGVRGRRLDEDDRRLGVGEEGAPHWLGERALVVHRRDRKGVVVVGARKPR